MKSKFPRDFVAGDVVKFERNRSWHIPARLKKKVKDEDGEMVELAYTQLWEVLTVSPIWRGKPLHFTHTDTECVHVTFRGVVVGARRESPVEFYTDPAANTSSGSTTGSAG
jgi:hypothetical protein